MNVFQSLLVFLCVFVLYFSSAHASGVYGTFRVVKGDVNVQSPDGKIKKARVGNKVFPQDKIVTGQDSRAKIVMIDDNVIDLSPASEIVFQKYEYQPEQNKKDVLLNVIYGKVRSKVNQKYDGANNNFKVKTPSAVAGVRGTDFFTSYNSSTKASSVVTFEGEVAYGIPGPNGSIKNAVAVRAGQMASNAMGSPPSTPRSLPKTQLSNLDKGSNADLDSSSNQRQPADDAGGNINNSNSADEESKTETESKDSPTKESSNSSDDGNAQSSSQSTASDSTGSDGGEASQSEGTTSKKDRAPSSSTSVGTSNSGPSSGSTNMGQSGDSMLTSNDIVGGGASGGGGFPDPSFLGNEFPDFNGVNTDATANVDKNFNPCVGNCSDIIRNVIEGGNTRVIIQLRNMSN